MLVGVETMAKQTGKTKSESGLERARDRIQKRMDRASERFNDRINEREERAERKAGKWEFHEEWHGGSGGGDGCCGNGMHWHSHGWSNRGGGTLGFIWPLVSSLFGVFFLFILASVFDYFGYKTGGAIGANSFFSATAAFIYANLGLLFGLMLLFGYAKWLTRRFDLLRPFKPAVKAARTTAALWVVALLFVATGIYASNAFFTWFAWFFQTQLLAVFAIFAVLAYVGFFIKMRRMRRWAEGKAEGYAFCEECGGMHFRDRKEAKRAAATASGRASAYKEEKWGGGRYRRLYRSDDNKILGGVCGGIAEYFDIDPVLVRLLWVVAALVWGVGVLAYIIAWIIIPARPRN